MVLKRALLCAVLLLLVSFVVTSVADTPKNETKIGIMNVQKVIGGSEAGKKVKAVIDAKMKSLQTEFKAEEQALVELQKEIEKKSSVWSDEAKSEKIREFQKAKRELKEKTDDATFEMRQLQNKELEPILKQLDVIVKAFGEKNRYTVILDEVRSGVLFLDNSIIVTDQLIEELNKAM